MERRFNDIASSIGDLVRQGLVRAVNVINDDIIAAIKALNNLERTNSDRRLVDAYTKKFNHLQRKKEHSTSLCDSMFRDCDDGRLEN